MMIKKLFLYPILESLSAERGNAEIKIDLKLQYLPLPIYETKVYS